MPGFRTPQVDPPADENRRLEWLRQLALIVLGLTRGKMNIVGSVTLTAGATSTVIDDPLITARSQLALTPTTANAAGALASTYQSATTSRQATLTHSNTGTTDRIFLYAVIG